MRTGANRGFTLIELAAIIIILGVLAAILLPALARSREAATRSSCQNNLKQWGVVFKMYANEHMGEWPAVSPVPNNWFPDVQALMPDYLTDLSISMCPSGPFYREGMFSSRRMEDNRPDPDCVTSLYYNYTSYLVFSDEQAIALFAAFRDRWQELRQHGAIQLGVPVWQGSNRVQLVGQSGMPVMWDRVALFPEEFNHLPGGSNVLHMDGHVEFVKYSPYNNSNFFPVTRVGAETFTGVLPRMPAKCYEP